MDIMELGAIGELVGGIAVVGSLLFVGIQIRSNTNQLRATANFEAEHSWVTLNEKVALHRDVCAFVDQALGSREGLDSLDRVDRRRLQFLFRATLQRSEAQFFLAQNGLMDKDLWTTRRTWLRGFLASPSGRAMWDTEVQEFSYTPTFVEEMGVRASGGA